MVNAVMTDGSPAVIVVERNPRVGKRIARVMAAAAAPGAVVQLEDAGGISRHIGAHTALVACGEQDIAHALELGREPGLRFAVWTTTDPVGVLHLSHRDPRICSILGWPDFQSMPRAWELAMVARRLTTPDTPPPRLVDLLAWGAREHVWRPTTTVDRDRLVGEVADIAVDCGAAQRVADRIASTAHELLMNAMFDAPIDADGEPRYALDRTQEIVLDDAEVPHVRLCADGMLLAVEVTDPFGRLRRDHVMDGVLRGYADDTRRDHLPADRVAAILDESGGGAGLGMHRLYATSAVVMCDVIAGCQTRVTAIHSLDISPREARSAPSSLHVFTV